MNMPAAIWPYIMGLCAVLAVVGWAGRDIPASRALCGVLVALLALRLTSSVYGDSSLYLAIAALVWALTATHVFRSGNTAAGGILVLSALCYFWASYTNAPRVIGSVPFVVSDVLLVTAIVWIGSSGICAFYQRTLDMGRGVGGYRDSSAGVHSQVVSKKSP